MSLIFVRIFRNLFFSSAFCEKSGTLLESPISKVSDKKEWWLIPDEAHLLHA
jgi:hypothetical protein